MKLNCAWLGRPWLPRSLSTVFTVFTHCRNAVLLAACGLGLAAAAAAQDAGVPPSILAEPGDQIVEPGADVTLTVVADGTPPLDYQWRLGGELLPTGTNDSLVISNAQPFDSGGYSVVVSNPYGTATSRTAQVVVLGPPVILTQPQDTAGAPGSNVIFYVDVQGASPLYYQWRFNDGDIPGATDYFLIVTNAEPADEGRYSVVVSNHYQQVISAAATLTLVTYVEDHAQFQVNTLGITGVGATEHDPLTGDDRGGIAVSATSVFVTGDGNPYSNEGMTARFSAANLSGGTYIGTGYNGLVSDLRTGRVYVLGEGDQVLPQGGGVISSLLEIDGTTGALTGQRINLTTPIQAFWGSGLFAGYGQIVVFNHFAQVYSIQVPSGFVSSLGQMADFSRMGTESWAFWGVAEKVNGTTFLVYVQDTRTIVRRRVPDGGLTPLATFTGNYGLADMASITASPRFGRWYFHHESWSQFRSGGDVSETVGFADATFTVDSGIYPARFVWGTLPGLQPVQTPFPVTLTAMTTSFGPATNFSGTVRLTATTLAGATVRISPKEVSTFVNGTWSGSLTVLEAAENIVLRAEDDIGLTGVSAPFSTRADDFGVFIEDQPDPLSINEPLTYTVLVVNAGPGDATGVWVTNTLPADVNLISVIASQGTCVPAAGHIWCDLGTLGRGTNVNVVITVVPAVAASLTNRVTAGRNEPDPNPANNQATAVTLVTAPPLVIDDAELVEGETGTQPLVFTVRLLQPTTNQVTVQFATANDTADPRDFNAAGGTITFPPNVTTQTVTVEIKGDLLFEADEIFRINLSQPVNAILLDAQAVGTIRDNDPRAVVTVGDATITEGDNGTNLMTFAVRLSAQSGLPVQVQYATRGDTAEAGTDFVPQTGEVVFLANWPGLLRNVSVPVLGDARAEADEVLHLDLIRITNGVLGNTSGTGTIVDDDIKFVWDDIPSPQPINTPVPVTISARYHDDTLAPEFSGPVTLTAEVPSPQAPGRMVGNLSSLDWGNGNYTIGFEVQVTEEMEITHVRHFSGVKVTIWDSNRRVLLSQNVSGTPGVWRETPVTVPVRLEPGRPYRVAFYSGGDSGRYYITANWSPTFAHGQIGGQYFAFEDAYPDLEIGGDAFFLVDLAYLAGQPPTPILIAPTTSGSFVNGSWSGEVVFLATGTNAVLRARDASNHTGQSQPLDVLRSVGADLALSMLPSANPLPAGNPVVFKCYVANHGPAVATNVCLTNPLPAGLTFNSAWASQGNFTNDNGVLVFELGTLDRGAEAFVTTEFQADADGRFTNAAVVVSAIEDGDPVNNQMEIVLAVCADCDDDGMDDAWEMLYGLDPLNPLDALLDFDGDGLTNLQEFQNGTNPFASDLPIILAQPENFTGTSGDTIVLSVVAEGTQPLLYRWYRNGRQVSGANQATLEITNAQVNAAGEYYALVTNPYGSVSSANAYVVLDPQDTFRLLELSTNAVQVANANAVTGDDQYGMGASSNSVFITGNSGSGRWNLADLSGGTSLAEALPYFVSDLRAETVYALGNGANPLTGGAGTFNSLLEMHPMTGLRTGGRIDLSTNINLNSSAGLFAGYGCIGVLTGGRFYHIRLPSGTVTELGTMSLPPRLTTESGAFWGVLEYFDGIFYIAHVQNSQAIVRTRVPDGRGSLLAGFSALSDMATWTFSPSLNRWFFHHEFSSQFWDGASAPPETVGSAAGAFTASAEYPWIRQMAANATRNQDSNVTFQVYAVGGEPLRYQWLHAGTALPGATNATVTLNGVQSGDAGQYTVIVSNALGAVSAAVSLTVLGAPEITSGPQDLLAAAESQARFSVAVYGAAPFFYQWRYNGVDLPGATNAMLVLSEVTTNDSGFYAVRVSNAYGTVTSAAAQLEVVEAGQFTDDFEPGIDPIQWLAFGGTVGETVIATNYGGSVSGANSLWFGDASERFATSRALNTLSGGTISFWFRVGSTSNPWENPDGGEDVAFEYSVDAGANWVNLGNYDETLTEWTSVTLPIPVGAQSEGTLFRWRQLRHSGASFDHWALDDVAIITGPTPPAIIRPPVRQVVILGGTATFDVVVSGSLPMSYQWRFNGVDLPEATNAVLQITNVQAGDLGDYSVFVRNTHGTAISDAAPLELRVDDLTQFRVTSLTTNNSQVVDHNNLTSDDRGGIAASATHVFITGDGATARYALADLSGGARLDNSTLHDSMIGDLRTQTVYVLGNGDTILNGAGTVTSLLELDGATGLPNGRVIYLSEPIQAASGSGLFSGYARALIYTGARVYSIQLPSGSVLDLGAMSSFGHTSTENWAFWGVAERVAGTNYLVYVQNSQTIARRRVPDGQTTTLATFAELGDMASITVSVPLGRWYFHHESSSVFSDGGEILGYADATFEVDSGIYPVRYEWDPLPPLIPVGLPTPVRLTAINSTGQPVTNHAGAVQIQALAAGGQPVALAPVPELDFVDGVWLGSLTFLETALNVTLVATDNDGIQGVSDPFEVRSGFAVFQSAAPDPVVVGQEWTNTMHIINATADVSTGVWLTNVLPANVDVVSATASQGACTVDEGVIRCDLQTLGIAASAEVIIVLRPAVPGVLTNTVVITRAEPDPDLADNVATVAVTVLAPPLVVDDLDIIEGPAGSQVATFVMRLLQATTNTVTVTCAAEYNPSLDTALPSRDFTPVARTVTFPPNVLTQTFDVTIIGDTRYENTEVFSVVLSNPSQASLPRTRAVGRILDDDPLPIATVADVAITEGDAGTNFLTFQVVLSELSGADVAIQYATSNGTATAGQDYLARAGTVEFRKDFQRIQNVNVAILGDFRAEPDETFELRLVSVTNAAIGQAVAFGTIRDNDLHFVFDPLPSPQPANTPIPITIRAQYYDGTPASNFNATVNLQAVNRTFRTNAVGWDSQIVRYPLGTFYDDQRSQIIYPANELGGAGWMTSLALDVATVPGQPMNNWTLRLKHTTMENYSSYQWEGEGWTTVFQDTLTVTSNGWLTCEFVTPFAYNGSNHLMVDFSFDNASYTTWGYCRGTQRGQYPVVFYETRSLDGDPLTWSGNSPGMYLSDVTPNLRVGFEVPLPVPVAPSGTGPFTNGVWAGTVSFTASQTNVQLLASDASQHTGQSAPFDVEVLADADLGVRMAAPTNLVSPGSNVTVSLTVSNAGPALGRFVIVTNPVPSGLAFVTATTSQGTVAELNGVVNFNLLNLNPGAAAQLTATFRATTPGWVTNLAAVRATAPDPNPTNNVAFVAWEVRCSDCDEDGMPDDWELAHGFDPGDPADAGADADTDGLSNLEEYWAGTDPRNAADVVRITSVAINDTDVRVTFQGKTGNRYVLERQDQIGGPWVAVAAFKQGAVPNVELIDFGAVTQPVRLYRVRMMR